eukprot:CAMPEP_0172494986 /NCGR_PEP_ID=MMETSP1066-20121228/60566_1 /TAXON_ID=671091 /ORGANISM="Coscinodiscus wailesii, Strain CCMP2513" /LENGTH=704 /DNA_ID=CAMNT_0013266361 /DNA_START=184 /DNA_END=2299 /DNA_ORIENTATION=-
MSTRDTVSETTPLLQHAEEANEDLGLRSETRPPSPPTLPTQRTNNLQSPTPLYRGFNTSICSLFNDPQDCCALACCGILQRDHTHYLFTNKRPPSLCLRLIRHVAIPLALLLLALFCATAKDKSWSESGTVVLIAAAVLYAVGDAILSIRESASFRQDVSWTMVQQQRGEQGAAAVVQSRDDAVCSHCTCLGCYGVDDDELGDVLPSSSMVREEGDMCTGLWRCFANMCCGVCGCWCMICGVCATAQEAREVKMFVGARKSMVDYVTFEHYSNYFPGINDLRRNCVNDLCSHWREMSQLSMVLMKSLGVVFLILAILGLLDFDEGILLERVAVFMATFAQAFIIVYFVHWKWNRFDLSIDAVVKFFASGFLLTTSLAVFFELLESLVLQIGLGVAIIFSGVKVETTNEHEGDGQSDMDYGDESSGETESLTHAFGQKHPFIMAFYLMCNSYLLAAFVEEVCKYFGFLMMDHPDLILEEDKERYCLERLDESDNSTNQNGINGSDRPSYANEDNLQHPSERDAENGRVMPGSYHKRSLNSIGAGITVAMVAVALGFACCENLIYIFVYAKGGIATEITVLFARSLFPVHPLCAAIQSIGVCRRVLENDKSYAIGWMILPAIILHGSFDFSLMLLTFIGDLKQSGGENSNEQVGDGGNVDPVWTFISLGMSCGIMTIGVIYYVVESVKQKRRLKLLDDEVTNNGHV